MRSRRALAPALVAALSIVASAREARAQFSFRPHGELVSGSGMGRRDTTNYAPGIRFPIESAPAFANSQVWGRGGGSGPGGGQCDTPNYSYPWHDNYCETRSWDMPMCPSGEGHQGQDIRPSTCRDNYHWVLSAVTGRVTNVGSYSVYITSDDGIRFDYLHMRSVQVASGARVTRGQRIGKVSNNFGGTPTTYHLHFNINRSVTGFGSVYAPPYEALIDAYERLLSVTPGMDAGVTDAALDTGADVRVDTGSVDARPDVGIDVRPDTTTVDARPPPDVQPARDVQPAVDVQPARDVQLPRDAAQPDVQEPPVEDDVQEPPVEEDAGDPPAEEDAQEPPVEEDAGDPPARDAGRDARVVGGETPGCACSVERGAPRVSDPRGLWAVALASAGLALWRVRGRRRRGA